MSWVRAHTLLQNWPAGGPPPSFTISSDENGTAVVELAFDPQALRAPANYTNPLRYYSTDVPFNERIKRDDGRDMAVNVPVQTIQLQQGSALWTMPAALWEAYQEEALKTLRTPSATTFARNLYFRVRVTAPGASAATVWPSDDALKSVSAALAPRIGLLPMSANPSSQVIPDEAALQAMPGLTPLFPTVMPTFWADILRRHWRQLPETDPARRALVEIFAHQTFRTAAVQTRADILRLWILAGRTSRQRLPRLLDRRATNGTGGNGSNGSASTVPIIEKKSSQNRTLVQELLRLTTITPHPDLLGVTTTEQLLDDVITEILDPNGQVNQGAAGTCVPTSIQTLMITVNPAEYARLQVGLLSRDGRATTAGGQTLDVPAGVYQAARYITNVGGNAFLVRTNSELGFQTAVLKFAQGSRFPSLTGTPDNLNQIFQATISAGLFSGETEKALEALFNVNFTVHEVPWPANPTNAGWIVAQTAVRMQFLQQIVASQPHLLWTYWGAAYGSPSPPGGLHSVLGIRRDNGAGRVFFKNPQYPGSSPVPGMANGGTAANPPRRYEDVTESLESITDADLGRWITACFVPDRALS